MLVTARWKCSAFHGYHCILAQGVPENECILILWNTQLAFLILCIDRSSEGHLTCCTALMIGFYLTLMYATVFHCFQNHNIGKSLGASNASSKQQISQRLNCRSLQKLTEITMSAFKLLRTNDLTSNNEEINLLN